MTEFTEQITSQPSDTGLRVGTVSQVAPLLVDLNGGPVREPGVLNGASLRVNDVVALTRQGSTWLVLGVVSSVPGFEDYLPAWSSTGTQPALNNGSVQGSWTRLGGSSTILARGRVTMGSTTTFGTGAYLITLPFAGSTRSISQSVGNVYLLDLGVQNKGGTCIVTSDGVRILLIASAGGDVTNLNPHTWASGDAFTWSITYEAA